MNNEISLCMIVKNEEKYLPACLESIKDIVDEIIIVDTGSTDKTVEIAQNYGAKVYYFKWNNNFSEARNVSLKYATKDWILIMDADDELQPKYRDNFKLLLNSKLDDNAVYFFETLNYCGDKPDDNCITINLNPRMFKNGRGFHYEGEIHNQLIYPHNEYNAIYNAVKIYHYGYLNDNIISKNKRKRNISILNKLIEKDPGNKFNYFNLGNEYTALDDPKKALEYYYKAYENFNPNAGFSPLLLLRIVISNYNIQEYTKTLNFIDIAVKYYPKFTDVYFFKALVYKNLGRVTLQIKALKKCVEIGEPPSQLKFFYGNGSFKAYFELGNIYMNFKDYDTAYDYYIKSLKSKPDFIDPIYCIAHILKEKNTNSVEFKNTIEKFFHDSIKAYPIIADIFYKEGLYKISLEYVEKCEEAKIFTDSINMLKAECLIRTGAFDECINMDSIKVESSFYTHFSMYRVLSCILSSKIDYASSILSSFEKNTLSDNDKKLFKVYSELVKLFKNEPTEIISENESQIEYAIILEICEILLINMKFDELKITVNLFNLIDNKYALLYLGKLYNNYGFVDLARKEVLRSIKEFTIYDNEGLDILKV
ncbi:tetratricopeptide repeat-containing glycosyltransferase family 2 protein [Clostridium ljungdahlii]|uniref:SPBc2 prophage-derived glycosyltransferase SunS n=1 Tax=Clostridium ljungdahlii TaxID=1538 RepID=A0A162J5K5_9CLOT|nr:glycosyltransferase family 2 protein [Clostridium ljungdahlii]OAA90625.1 SPBc2 prophage-derived glycosyltransferase SunS [Clostridium ljungdahlii]